jgi:hypothetical protein
MTTTTRELLAANDMLRDEFPDALIVDSALHCNGFQLTVIPRDMSRDSQVGKGATVEDAMADLRARFAADDPVEQLRAKAEKLGYSLVKNDAGHATQTAK